MKALRTGVLFLCALGVVACIHVVVNVYFPEAEAKGALATLEDELLHTTPPPKADQPVIPPKPGEPAPKPQSFLRAWIQPQVAWAAGPVTEEQIVAQIRSMPAVMDAYRRMAGRMPRVDALRNAGQVGEGRDGLLSPRAELAERKDQRTVEDENSDRQVVIQGLAKASLAAQGQPVTDESLKQVLPDSASTFAALRRDKARSGWWIQAADGTWSRKP